MDETGPEQGTNATERKSSVARADPDGPLREELENTLRGVGAALDDDSVQFAVRLRTRGILGDDDWAAMQADLADAARFLSEPNLTVQKLPGGTTLVDPDADPRNANWLGLAAANDLAHHDLPAWATMSLWRRHNNGPKAFWWQVGSVGCTLGYPCRSSGVDTAAKHTAELVVVGVDACLGGWIVVALRGGQFDAAMVLNRFADILDRFSTASAIAVDIPIGLAERGPREADVAARALLGNAYRSVFLMPSRSVLAAPTFAKAQAAAAGLGEPGISQQAYALRRKVHEVDLFVPSHPQTVEVHPEVSFLRLNGDRSLASGKRTWNGLLERRRLLTEAGIVLPDHLPGVSASPDDVVDAAAAAWTAMRVSQGVAQSLPLTPQYDIWGRSIAIWS